MGMLLLFCHVPGFQSVACLFAMTEIYFADVGDFLANISNAYVSGMQTDLKLYGNQLNWMTTFWTIGMSEFSSMADLKALWLTTNDKDTSSAHSHPNSSKCASALLAGSQLWSSSGAV